ncbi:unnamed protein product, partial [Mesorhabditis spiculigera]
MPAGSITITIVSNTQDGGQEIRINIEAPPSLTASTYPPPSPVPIIPPNPPQEAQFGYYHTLTAPSLPIQHFDHTNSSPATISSTGCVPTAEIGTPRGTARKSTIKE